MSGTYKNDHFYAASAGSSKEPASRKGRRLARRIARGKRSLARGFACVGGDFIPVECARQLAKLRRGLSYRDDSSASALLSVHTN